MKKIKRKREITETYYRITCNMCGKEFETQDINRKQCDECMNKRIACEKEELKNLFIGATIIDVCNDNADVFEIKIKTKNMKIIKINTNEYDNNLDYEIML